jgi:uncharacterized protein (UPF0264 family)
MPDAPHRTPQLLVSVRSAGEAQTALAGGCDLIDVKEPSRGSLGAADLTTISAICEATRTSQTSAPISVALGELDEWPPDRDVPALPAAVTLAKLGLSFCTNGPDWPSRWCEVRRRFDAAASRPIGWIAVLYADQSAQGPDPSALIDLAATTGCRGLLVDTFRKDGLRLLDHVAPEQLATWRTATANADLLFAVAGSLRAADLPRLVPLQPDVIAVRGAACRSGDRTAEIDADAVRRFRQTLRKTFGPR